MALTTVPIASSHRTLSLRRRDDLASRPALYRGESYWVVKDPVSLEYFQLRDEEHFLLSQLNGHTSLRELQRRFHKRYSPRRIELAELQSFLAMLHEGGLIVSSSRGQGPALLERQRKTWRNEWLKKLLSPLAIRFRGIDAEPVLACIYPRVRWMFSFAFLTLCVVFVLATILGSIIYGDTMVSQLSVDSTFLNSRNLFLFVMAVGFTKILHELGHGLTCRHFGGECHEIGLMLLVGTPCLYCNVSDAWMLRSKWQRMAISGAGIGVELVLGCLAVWGFWFFKAGLAQSLCLAIAAICTLNTLLINGNPLLRYDGYYILADWLEVPNLWQQSRRLVHRACARWFIGMDLDPPRLLAKTGHGVLYSYGLASMAYRWFVIVAILWMLHAVLGPMGFQPIVHVLGLVLIGGMVVPATVNLYRQLAMPQSRQNWSSGQIAVSALMTLIVVGVAVAIPLPRWVTAPGVARPNGAKSVFVEVTGTLLSSVAIGDHVKAGDVVARLEQLELIQRLAELRGQRDEQESHLTSLRNARVIEDLDGVGSSAEQLPIAEEMWCDLSRQVEQTEAELERLVVRSPGSGLVMGARRRSPTSGSGELAHWTGSPLDAMNRGTMLENGTELCVIGDPSRWKILVALQQADLNRVRVGQPVQVRLDPFPSHEFIGEVTEISQMDLDEAPPELVAIGDVATELGAAGDRQLAENLYQATVTLEPTNIRLVNGATGRVRVAVESETISRRARDWVLGLFRNSA